MAPIKFEDDLKSKLENREINPSSDSWDKLSQRLDTEKSTSSKNYMWWIGLAASIIGVSFFVFQLLSNSINKQNPPAIVDTPQNKEDNTSFEIIKEIEPEPESELANKEESDKTLKQIKEMEMKNNPVLNESPIQIVEANKLEDSKDIRGIISKPENTEEVIFEMEKAQEVAKTIYELSETDKGVSSNDIDSLLKAAQREILLNRIKNKDQVTINAALLLQEVEYELDESFRDKVFQTIKNSYGTIKTALAQRNE